MCATDFAFRFSILSFVQTKYANRLWSRTSDRITVNIPTLVALLRLIDEAFEDFRSTKKFAGCIISIKNAHFVIEIYKKSFNHFTFRCSALCCSVQWRKFKRIYFFLFSVVMIHFPHAFWLRLSGIFTRCYVLLVWLCVL